MDQATPEVSQKVSETTNLASAKAALHEHTNVDVAYTVFGRELYSGLYTDSDSEVEKQLLFAKHAFTKKRESGYYTIRSERFISATVINDEVALFEKLKAHFSLADTKKSINYRSFLYAECGGIQNEFDTYSYASNDNMTGRSIMSGGARTGQHNLDLIQLNDRLSVTAPNSQLLR
jgi:hypothetical protein